MLRNQFMARHLEFDPAQGLFTRQWTNLRSGTDFLDPSLEARAWLGEFSLALDDSPPLSSYGPGWSLDSAEAGPLDLHLELSRPGLRVWLHYQLFEQHPVLRKRVTVQNTGEGPLVISQLILESAELRAGAPADQKVYNFYGRLPAELFITGRMNDPLIVQQNSRTGEALLVMNEVPGILKRTDTCWTWAGGVQAMYDTDLLPFERTLGPGESFAAAPVSIGFSLPEGPTQPEWALPGYTAAVLTRKGRAYQAPWMYNTWEHFFRNIDQGLLQALIPVAGQMGLEIFTIDDGWQARLGETGVRLSHFPDGLDPLRQEVEAAGMRLGLWAALAVVDPESQVYREHPEWQAIDRHGRPRQTFTMSGMQMVMCLATPYRDFITGQLLELIERYGLAYLKLDLTTVFNTYGESPGCFGAGHEHATWAESLTRIYEAIAEITAALYARHPELLIDLTFELWGQKHLIDYGLLAAGDMDWLSNIHDLDSNGPRQARTLLYHRALAIPTEAMLIGNLQANMEPIAERFATTIGSAPLLLGDLRQLSAEQIAWYREQITWYKALRAEVPLYEGFFTFGQGLQPQAGRWDGYARLSRAGEGFIALFKNDDPAAEALIQLPLLEPGPYRLAGRFSGQVMPGLSQADFIAGLLLPLKAGVEVWELRREA
jgi:alpha-galactosidase